MNGLRKLLSRYPIPSYFLLSIVIGWGIILLVLQGIIPEEFAITSAFSASLAGIIMTLFLEGLEGFKPLLSRFYLRGSRLGTWILAFFFPVPIFLTGSLANPVFHGDDLSFKFFQPAFSILEMIPVFFVISGLGQEIGWSGFLLPRLQSRYNALTSGIIRAILVGIWHIPLFLYNPSEHPELTSFPYATWVSQSGLLVAFALYFILLNIPWTIMFTWSFNHSNGNLLMVAVFHTSEIWVAWLMTGAGIDPNNLNNYWGYGTLLLLTAIMIIQIYGARDLSQNHKKSVHITRS